MDDLGKIPNCTIPGVARCFLRAGISVVPLKPNSKEPSIKWKDYTRQHMSDAFVDEFFTPESNIAIVTGSISGITILDVDDLGKFSQFYPHIEKLYRETGIISKTAHDKPHFWFKYEPDLGSKQFQEFGFDLRNDNSLVTVPPSKIDGRTYRFEKWERLTPIPEDLKELLKTRKEKPSDSKQEQENELLETILSRLEVKYRRPDGTYRCFCPAHDDHHPSLDVGLRNNRLHTRCWAGCSQKEILQAIGIEIEEEKKIKDSASSIKSIGVLNFLMKWNDILALDIKTEYLLERLIPSRAIILLFGRGGTGKTSLALQIGHAIAEGIPFGDLKTIKTRVYYIDFENPLSFLKERGEKIGESKNFYVWHISNELPPPKLDSKEWELYKDLPPGLLIFDTLRAAHLSDENDSKPMSLIMGRLKELRELGFTIILLHHTPKGNENIFKGSTAFLDLADHVLGLEEVKDSDTIEFDKNNLYRLGVRFKTRYDPYHIYLTFNPDVKGFEIAKDPDLEKLKEIYELMKQFKSPLNQTELRKLIKDNFDLPETEIRRLLKKGEGLYWKIEKGGKNASLYTPLDSVCQFDNIYNTYQTNKLEFSPSKDLTNTSPSNMSQSAENSEFDSLRKDLYQTNKLEFSTPSNMSQSSVCQFDNIYNDYQTIKLTTEEEKFAHNPKVKILIKKAVEVTKQNYIPGVYSFIRKKYPEMWERKEELYEEINQLADENRPEELEKKLEEYEALLKEMVELFNSEKEKDHEGDFLS